MAVRTSWDFSLRGPEGQALVAAIPIGLSLWEAFRPGPTLPAMPWPQRPMTLSEARARIAQAAAPYQQRIQQALQSQAQAMARRGMYGQAGADAVMAEVAGSLENQALAQQQAAALGLYQSDLARYLDQLRTVADYLVNRARLQEARRDMRRRAIIDALRTGLDIYGRIADYAGRYPFTGSLTPTVSAGAVDYLARLDQNL